MPVMSPPASRVDVSLPAHLQAALDQVIAQAQGVILGKEQQIKLALACLL